MVHELTRAAAGVRPFQIAVRNCRRCGREWPAHIECCYACAAALGEARPIRCERVVPPRRAPGVAPMLAVVLAIELARRHPPHDVEWAAVAFEAVAPALGGAGRIRPGAAGSIVAAWPLEHPGSVPEAALLALELAERMSGPGSAAIELRGGLALGVIAGEAPRASVELSAERLALAAAPGQWLVCGEAARRLEDRFELRPVGVVPRWPMSVPEDHRALVARIRPPVLPSAVNGEPPEIVLGRSRERRQLSAELASAAHGARRVLLITAPAGGGKSYLLRRVLADAELTLGAGVAFPPLGSPLLDPLRALLAALDRSAADCPDAGLSAALAAAAAKRAREEPVAIVIDDIHWAHQQAVAALSSAIAASNRAASVAWILSARTAALPALGELAELADVRIELAPLEPPDRTKLLASRLGELPETVREHVAQRPERGNPLYLEHLAGAIAESRAEDALPGSLHEAVLARLDGLLERARLLMQWRYSGSDARHELEALECEVGDWLDRLETTDVADLATIGRYLARLRAVDLELVVARSVLRMPVGANRRLAWATERLAAASTDALLDYLGTLVADDKRTQAVSEAEAAAERAERKLRLADAEGLLAFAIAQDCQRRELLRKRGDVALALGRADDAVKAYRALASGEGDPAELQRRLARAEALAGDVEHAVARLERLTQSGAADEHERYAARLDLARLRGTPAPEPPRNASRAIHGLRARVAAWERAGEPRAASQAAASLVLAGGPIEAAAVLIDTAALCRIAGLEVVGLHAAAVGAASDLTNPRAAQLCDELEVSDARRTFLHWEA